MTLTDFEPRRKGRPSIEEIPLPPHVQRALVLRGNGSSWKDAAESVGMDYRTLRKYVRDHPDANEFLERQTQDALDQSHSKLIAAAPAAAQRLIDVINDEGNRGYVVVQAVESLFRIIDRGITDRENAEQLKEIRNSINALEGGKIINV
ncbi:hypothetical protein [Prochlorococcus sp. MIT 0801]|uniref:hypothetical protein n=1 Tax=Prochlorococcus sp. MIT 0801 TaxID=1501269 RepID=UPI0004F72981|nr:hypothetical protein [Prochlorococcus sp. MIT 0801]AIQ97580.1 hypothetical protein EW15_1488 [Prochlorococcus sp. MIT 0801]